MGKKNFWNAMRSKNPDRAIVNALQIGTDSEGGYLVPDEFERTLVDGLSENNIFRTLAHVIQTTSGDRRLCHHRGLWRLFCREWIHFRGADLGLHRLCQAVQPSHQ